MTIFFERRRDHCTRCPEVTRPDHRSEYIMDRSILFTWFLFGVATEWNFDSERVYVRRPASRYESVNEEHLSAAARTTKNPSGYLIENVPHTRYYVNTRGYYFGKLCFIIRARALL